MSFARKIVATATVTSLRNGARLNLKMATGEQVEIDFEPAKLKKLITDLTAAQTPREAAAEARELDVARREAAARPARRRSRHSRRRLRGSLKADSLRHEETRCHLQVARYLDVALP